MSIEVERGLGLEREGIETDRVRWNLSDAALYEEAIRRQEGVVAAARPPGLPHRPAHRPLAERQVRRPRTVERGEHRLGQGQPADGRGAVGPAASRFSGLAEGQGAVRARCVCRRRSRSTACRFASSPNTPGTTCSAATCSSSIPSGAASHAPQFTVIDSPSFKADPARHGTQERSRDRASTSRRSWCSSAAPATPAR